MFSAIYKQYIEIENEIRSHPILNHPFLIKLSHGGYGMDQMQLWVAQQFYFSNQFPRCLGLLWARMPDYEMSLPLMKFLSIEHWGSEEPHAHWKLYRKVLNHFSLNINDLKKSAPLRETEEYLSSRFNICHYGSIEEALGCMGFGHELVNETIFKAYYHGVSKIENITPDALEYFISHIEDEPEDYEIFKKLILSFSVSEKSLSRVRDGALISLTNRIVFFDKIMERLDSH